MNPRVLNVFGHFINDTDSIRYRVQWDNGSVSWADGNDLSLSGQCEGISRYWQISPHQFVNEETQTEPVRSFNFSSLTDANSDLKSFHAFESSKKYLCENPPNGMIPYKIISVRCKERKAIVQFYDTQDTQMIDLDWLISIAPRLVASFFLQKNL